MDHKWYDAVSSSARSPRFPAEDADNPRTYPTTYMWFGSELSGFLASDTATTTLSTCSRPTKGTELTLPPSADPSSLVAIVGTTSFGQKVSSTSSKQDPSLMPSSILGYLDTLPEVREQLSGIPITSCAYLAPQPERCTVVETVTSTGCGSGSGNLTRACSEGVATVTSTVAASAPTGLGPIFVPRRPAAYLTYNTLTLSEGAEAALNDVPVETTSTTSRIQSKETETGFTFERIPSITAEGESAKDSTPTAEPVDASHAAEPQPAEAVVSALVSLAVASEDTAKATEPAGTTDDSRTGDDDDDDDEDQRPAPAGVVEQSNTQSIGNLLSALQGVASQAATSQGPVAASLPQDSHSATGEVEPQTGDENPADGSKEAPSTTATKPSVPVTMSSVLPIFNFQGQTVTAGGAVIFGGNAVSQLPDQGGVVIDHDRTVLLSDGEATVLSQQDSQPPITISRSGTAVIVNSQTIPANQEITAGQTTASASASASGSSAVLYINGTPIPLTSTTDGESPTTSTGMGGYINSGIGGDAGSGRSEGSGSSDGNSANATDGAVTPFTGDGSKASLWGGTCAGCMLGLLAVLGVVCML
jgi:hypothetical protein